MRVSLEALDRAEADEARYWRNDPRIMRWCRQTDFISDLDQANWFDRQSKDPSVRMFSICYDTTLLGVCGLTSIDWVNRRAEFSLYIAPCYQGKGYGRETLISLFNHGFSSMNLEQIWGETFEGNTALKLFKSLGMKEDGIRRKFYFKDGRYHDCTLISILREEWDDRPKISGD